MTFKPITHDPLITMPIIGILEDWVSSGQKNVVQVYILHHVFELAELNLDFKICTEHVFIFVNLINKI